MNLFRSTTRIATDSMNRSPVGRVFLLTLFVLACFALLPNAQAVITDPDETFPNFNTAAGLEALLNLTTGISNTAYGARALRANTTGGSNLGIGGFALINNTDGNMNIAIGNNAMFSNQHGNSNMALGQGALRDNVSGNSNVAIGAQALASNNADGIVAVGYQALNRNTGDGNTAIGYQALLRNASGPGNTATGAAALFFNTHGGFNTATGASALIFNTGDNNTGTGSAALGNSTVGDQNTADGAGALQNITGSDNIGLGFAAGTNLTTSNNNIDIGSLGMLAEDNTIRIGTQLAVTDIFGILHPAHTRTFIAGIRGRTTANANAVPVVIDSAGQLGTASSSRRFKNEIKPMDKTSEAILALKPVTFHYKSDNRGTPQFGLIAEEVAKVNPDLIVRDENGEIYTVRYDAVNAMLLNEFLKEHRKVQELTKEFQATVAQQQKQIEALTAGLQKVSAEIQISKPAPRVAENAQ